MNEELKSIKSRYKEMFRSGDYLHESLISEIVDLAYRVGCNDKLQSTDELRLVIVYEYQRVKREKYSSKVAIGTGFFREFGVNYEEVEGCPGNYSTAIVEMPDGSVKNVPVEMIVFKN